MDGLMFDTEPLWGQSWEPALAAHGLSYKPGLAEACRGAGSSVNRQRLLDWYGPDCPADAVIRDMHNIAEAKFAAPVPKKPGLDELLAWLDEKGVPMAVVSSSSEAVIRRNLDNWGLGRYFKAVVAGEMVSHSKPDPEVFLKAAGMLGLEPAVCLVVEDAVSGAQAGHAGGFAVACVGDASQAGAGDYNLSAFSELRAIALG